MKKKFLDVFQLKLFYLNVFMLNEFNYLEYLRKQNYSNLI